ncbi:MAG: sugar ABC transporter substrate-binding protein [Rhizobiales bacterium]|nr:sugar ABC transporter substrate-binding protein [Hyphomicrobiales bacterium]NRB13483.1 sugar ABC transporter substrate-binding protein [Hyphomicrobiales bacterium]
MKLLKLAAVSMLALGTFSGAQAAETELHMIQCGDNTWGGDFAEKHIAEWEAQNPGFKVNLEYLAWGQCQDKAKTLAAAGNAPALAYMGSRTLKQLAKNNLIIPINMTDADKATYAPPVLGTVTADGQVWGAPRAFSTKAFFWNKDLFTAAGLDPETPPKTWDEMYSFAEQIIAKTDAQGVGLAAASFDNTMHQFMNYVYSNGGEVINSAGDIVFNSPQNVETMAFYGKLASVSQTGPIAYDRAKLGPLFINGQIAMYIDGPWARARLNEGGVNYGVGFIPAGPSGASGTLLITDSLAVFKGTGVEEQALSLAKYLTNPVNQFEFEMAAGLTPLRAVAGVKDMIAEDPTWAAFLDIIPAGGPEPFVTDYVGLQDAINDAIQSVVLGEATPAEAVAAAAEELEDTK